MKDQDKLCIQLVLSKKDVTQFLLKNINLVAKVVAHANIHVQFKIELITMQNHIVSLLIMKSMIKAI